MKTQMLGNHAYSFNLIARRKNALSDLQGFSEVITAYHWTIPKLESRLIDKSLSLDID